MAFLIWVIFPLWAAGQNDTAWDATGYLKISGVYPHLSTHNQPDDPADQKAHAEAGTGAIVPWAGHLWYLSYPQHKTRGSNDKLYQVDPQMNLTIRPESIGGTHANRMIHRESKQLIMGAYFIDDQGNVRVCDVERLVGRMTATMRHLFEPKKKVYFFDMEGAIYEVDVHTLEVERLFRKPFPGWHGKGAYTGQNRVVFANNGERNSHSYQHLLVGGPAEGEEAGALVQWNGKRDFDVILRKQFTDVTGPGGIEGNPDSEAPIWSIGWDKRSVILQLLDGGNWYTFRLPKGSHAFDHRHGWYTEWPRIREIAPHEPMMCMLATMFDFPIDFRHGKTAGIRPMATHLRYVPDFCHWRGKVIIGADEASMMHNPLCGQAQSNLWFGDKEEIHRFGPRQGWGGPLQEDAVEAGRPSVPYFFAGYDRRIVHLMHDHAESVEFTFQVDRRGNGKWEELVKVDVPPGKKDAKGYAYHLFDRQTPGEWIRVIVDRDCTATAYFLYDSLRNAPEQEKQIFQTLAHVDQSEKCIGGIVRPAWHNTSLQWLVRSGENDPVGYREVKLMVDAESVTKKSSLYFDPAKNEVHEQTEKMEKLFDFEKDYLEDEASLVVTDYRGIRYRLPKGPGVTRVPHRGVREIQSERYAANLGGIFYELPRGADNASPDFDKMKPIASHDRLITDFCSWRGLLVLSGVRADASPDAHCFVDGQGNGLWFGSIEDLWRFGKPVGRGGPWVETPVKAGDPSDPFLMTGFDQKELTLSHDASEEVAFLLEIDFDHTGFVPLKRLTVAPGEKCIHRFPQGFQAHWIRLTTDQDCKATAWFEYR
jgi:hypothetical protein